MKLAGFEVGERNPLFLIAGPCVIESKALAFTVAERLAEITAGLSMPLIFKASFHKANRTSAASFRGPGLEAGLRVLEQVRETFALPVLTDVHEDTPLDEVAAVVDVLQTPAFLCRQTNFMTAVARCGRPVNVKKGQFLSPPEMRHVVEKMRAAGNEQVLVCERGFCFGYHDLVADMRSLAILRETGCPVVFDATHAVQRPGGRERASGGDRRHIPVLARAAVAAGVAGVFLETHPDPGAALCDGPNAWPLDRMRALLERLSRIDAVVKAEPYAEAALPPATTEEDPNRKKTMP